MRKALVLFVLVWAGCRKPVSRYAVIKTSMGVIGVHLFDEKTPKTVENFAALSTGRKKWRNPRTRKETAAPLYNGVLFHRVIPGFMIQTGDPAGDGGGDVGFTFSDEIRPDLRFDRPGLLGMANAGRDTNASQFFITLSPQPGLDGLHTIFGEVVKGLDVAEAISKAPRDEAHEANRPLKPIRIESIMISDKAP